ncbi:hypothetical protein WH95_00155 [Kiloniella litopenaei]|uniref:Uncharacterized protein n=1 Tax=Kiloniella litopenaei TaxID=1549748 RepID=A0A0M2RA65_9PROT|nr:hypothetical protein WH95_00155 [Kiloniella litopenaei]
MKRSDSFYDEIAFFDGSCCDHLVLGYKKRSSFQTDCLKLFIIGFGLCLVWISDIFRIALIFKEKDC